MNKRFSLPFPLWLPLLLFAIFAIQKPGIAHAYNYTFSDNFASATVGSSVNGYNGWTVGDASDTQGAVGQWDVATSTSGNVAQWFPDSPSNYNYYLQYMANGDNTLSDTNLQADFEIPASGTYNYSPSKFDYNPQLWVRRTSATGDGGGYLAFYQSDQWYIAKHLANTGSAYTVLAQTTSTLTMSTSTWYTGVLQVANNASGTPQLSLWVYAQGGTPSSSPMLTASDASDTFNTGYFGIGTCLESILYTNIAVQATDTGVLTITSPARAVSASSTVATLAITNSLGNTFYIPYIQTSSTLAVAASVGSAYMPAGGGVKFVLTNNSSSKQYAQYSTATSSPYNASFVALPKGTYTLNAYVVNSSDTVQTGPADSDEATDIGIGDIITAIGDSITAGYPVNYGALSNWVQAESSSTIPVSNDGRNYPQEDYFNHNYEAGYLPTLNNLLTAYYGFPVFIDKCLAEHLSTS